MRPLELAKFLILVPLLLLFYGWIAVGIKYDISFIFFNVQQAFGGTYGDKFIVAICSLFISTMVARYFNIEMARYFTFGLKVQDISRFLISPTKITAAAGVLACSSPEREPKRQQLVLLTYVFAIWLRFCGSQHDVNSQYRRLLSRFWESLLYMWLPKCSLLWDWRLLLPCATMVCAGRSNEVFRIWRNNNRAQNGDHEQAKEGFQQVDGMLTSSGLFSTQSLPWPTAAASTPPHGFNRPDLLPDYGGVYRHMLHFDMQYTFLWVEGSGMLVCLAYAFLIFIILTSAGPQTTFCLIVTIAYITMQCFPGFLARLNMAINLVTDTNADGLAGQVLQKAWFADVVEFMQVLLQEGLPLDGDETFMGSEHLGYLIKRLQGIELMCYVLPFAMARLIIRGCLLCLASFFKMIKLGNLVKGIWSKWIGPNLAYVAVKLTAPDILKATKTIVKAEAALDSRTQCNTSECIQTVRVAELLETFQTSIQGDYTPGKLSLSLFDLAFTAVNEAAAACGEHELIQHLRQLLHLLTLYHLETFKRTDDVVAVKIQLKDKLEVWCKQRWDAYTKNTAARARCNCVNETDWKVMKAQLHVSLLVQAHEQPRRGERLSFTAVMLWMEVRKEKLDAMVDIVST